MTKRILRWVVYVLVCAAALAMACGAPPDGLRVGVVAPDPAQFPPVSAVLDHRCGSLDCHGARTRNLQIYGCEGLRLGDAAPGCRNSSGIDTTGEEHDATYRSLVALEPAVMSSVVQEHGVHPELFNQGERIAQFAAGAHHRYDPFLFYIAVAREI